MQQYMNGWRIRLQRIECKICESWKMCQFQNMCVLPGDAKLKCFTNNVNSTRIYAIFEKVIS